MGASKGSVLGLRGLFDVSSHNARIGRQGYFEKSAEEVEGLSRREVSHSSSRFFAGGRRAGMGPPTFNTAA